MQLNKKMCELIAQLEYCIGAECYNPNSYDGWNDIDGCDFRYPISFPDNNGNYIKIRGNIYKTASIDIKDINKDTIPFIKYKFGSNELYVGKGIVKILKYLEDRYNIDFVEMEKNLKVARKKDCEKQNRKGGIS